MAPARGFCDHMKTLYGMTQMKQQARHRPCQVRRVRGDPCEAMDAMLLPPHDLMPARLWGSRHFHVGIHPKRPSLQLMAALRALAHRNGGKWMGRWMGRWVGGWVAGLLELLPAASHCPALALLPKPMLSGVCRGCRDLRQKT